MTLPSEVYAAPQAFAAPPELWIDPECGPGGLVEVAAGLGWDLGRPHAGAVFHYGGESHGRWLAAVGALRRPARREGRAVWTLLGADPEGELSAVRLRLEEVAGAGTVRAACGPVVSGAAGTASSFRAAAVLLRVLSGRAGRLELPYERAGLTQLLLATPPDRLRAFADRHLGPIAEREDLLATLECWLATRGSRRAVSERLHLHRNSVGHRVNLIKRLLRVDPLDPATSATLQAALAARELLAALDPDGRTAP